MKHQSRPFDHAAEIARLLAENAALRAALAVVPQPPTDADLGLIAAIRAAYPHRAAFLARDVIERAARLRPHREEAGLPPDPLPDALDAAGISNPHALAHRLGDFADRWGWVDRAGGDNRGTRWATTVI